MPKVLGNLRGCKALPKCWSRLWFFTPMEVWFAATGLRLHREPGALPSAGAEPHVSAPSVSNEQSGGIQDQHLLHQELNTACKCWGGRGVGGGGCWVPLTFAILWGMWLPLAQSRFLSFLSGVTWGQGQPWSPSIKRSLVGVGEQTEPSKLVLNTGQGKDSHRYQELWQSIDTIFSSALWELRKVMEQARETKAQRQEGFWLRIWRKKDHLGNRRLYGNLIATFQYIKGAL